MKTATAIVFAALMGSGLSASVQAVERPPQFVVISFDNCTQLERWQELADFLADMNKADDRVHFTFFVSGINYLAHAGKNAYQAPGHGRGASNIGFGGSPEEVERRVAYINKLRASGNEIGSHAVGHFDGRGWSAAEWAQEFRSYNDLFSNVAARNNLPASVKLDFSASEIAGFRAPYLGRGAGLYAALADHRFRYDASGTGNAGDWPEKKGGLWRFNLANLRIAGSGKYTLSMDYNFLIAQSGVAANPRHQELYREQMLGTYLQYFKSNYAGNRAPVHIGHHFTGYQGGVYQQALTAFARMVCVLPEVRCVSYAKLADFMDRLDAATLKAYQSGDFPRAAEPALDPANAFARERR